jgi:hypothetical protein
LCNYSPTGGLRLHILVALQSTAQPDDIDAVNGGLVVDGDGESDYGQIDEELSAKIIEDLEREWALAFHEEAGDGIKEQEQEPEQEQEQEEQEQEQDHKRMEVEE